MKTLLTMTILLSSLTVYAEVEYPGVHKRLHRILGAVYEQQLGESPCNKNRSLHYYS